MDAALHQWNQAGVFMRLSSRSPKDYHPHLIVASRSGQDIVNRLVCSGRSRACLREYLATPDPSRPMNVVLLPWDHAMACSLEFRCFVHHKKLNCISQYDPYTVCRQLQPAASSLLLRDRIVFFHDQIKDRVPYPSYVMDVVFKPSSSSISSSSDEEQDPTDVSTLDCHLIEFNPFYADVSSGASLFDWERDYTLMYEGLASDSPPIIRIRVDEGKKRTMHQAKRAMALDLV